jgi:uncharacterized protein (DUF2267 family)
MTGIHVFDKTLHEANQWLRDIGAEMGDGNVLHAYHAMRGTLFALRDRLPPQEASHLASQLPALVRGVFYEGYRPAGKPAKMDRDEFLQHVRRELDPVHGPDTERAARAVLRVIEKRISAGEVEDVLASMPKELRSLW